MENQEQQRRRETHAPERNPNPCILAAQGVNISDMTNKSRDKYAYTLLDLEHKPEETTVEKLKAIEGVLRVRVVK